ncbi:MAG TPA: ParB/RepB/Spo0J family partition protein [Micropepsaceae bacterium]|nr:ParB/RepB/Spo0J family partition protein [Micropepsaceae bacterium]
MADEARTRNLASRGLGRGLSALLGDGEPDIREAGEPMGRSRNLPIAFLRPNPFQPRRIFNAEEMKNLTASIAEKGVLQPVLVRPTGTPDQYEIVAGERRWRAAQAAKLHEIPVIVRALSDVESLEIAIIENVQRADLNAIEEAAAYQELMSKFRYTQEQVSDMVGKSRSHVANTLRLLKLPDSVKTLISEGKLTAGHARTLIGVADPEMRAQEIVGGALNVREAEKKARAPRAAPQKPKHKDADTKALEHSLSGALGMDVQIEHQGRNGGTVKIQYKDLEQLDEIIRRLNFYGEVD